MLRIKRMAAVFLLPLRYTHENIQTITAISRAMIKCTGPNGIPAINADNRWPKPATKPPALPPSNAAARSAGKESKAMLPTKEGILIEAPMTDRARNNASKLIFLTLILLPLALSVTEYVRASDILDIWHIQPEINNPGQREKIIGKPVQILQSDQRKRLVLLH